MSWWEFRGFRGILQRSLAVFMQPLKNFGFFEKLIAMNDIKNRKQKSVPSAQIQILRVLGFFFRLNQLIHP